MMIMNGEYGRIWKDIVMPPCVKDCSGSCLDILKRSTRNMDSSVSTVTRLWSGDRKTGSPQQKNEFLYLSPCPGWTWGPLRLKYWGYRKHHPRNREADTWSPLAQCRSEGCILWVRCLTTFPVTDIIRRWFVRWINTRHWWSEYGKK